MFCLEKIEAWSGPKPGPKNEEPILDMASSGSAAQLLDQAIEFVE
jgi:hypothetical protein